MLELGMVFALGFCTAGLLALACLPAVWRRALRLTNHRLRQLVPLSPEEIAAEQSGLRARFAVGQRRLEQRIEASDTARADLLASLARRDAEAAALREAAARDAARLADLRADLDAARREAADLDVQMAAANLALMGLEALADRRLWDAEEARGAASRLGDRVDEDRASIAAFETRVLGLDTRVADLGRALDKVTADLIAAEAEGRRTTAERDGARQAAESLAAKRDALQTNFDRLTAELARHRDRAAAAEERAVAGTQAVAAQAETIQDLKAQLAAERDAARRRNAEIEEMRAENAVRKPAASQEADFDGLRATLRQVADDVLRMAEGAGRPAARPTDAE